MIDQALPAENDALKRVMRLLDPLECNCSQCQALSRRDGGAVVPVPVQRAGSWTAQAEQPLTERAQLLRGGEPQSPVSETALVPFRKNEAEDCNYSRAIMSVQFRSS